MIALVGGDLLRRSIHVRFEVSPVLKPAAGDYVADPTLVHALCVCLIKGASPQREAPVLGKGMRLCIVDQNLRRNNAEPQECAFHPREPVCLPLPQRRPDIQPAQIAQHTNEQVNPNTLTTDPNLYITKVDLHLMGRGRLEANRRGLLRL